MNRKISHFVPSSAAARTANSETLDRIAGVSGATHEFRPVRRGAFNAGPVDADMIVVHLPLRWRTFPLLVALRATNPEREIVLVEQAGAPKTRRRRFAARPRVAEAARSLFDRVVPAAA